MSHKSSFFLTHLLLLLLVVANLLWGSVHLDVAEVGRVVCGQADPQSTAAFIVLQSRLPQLLTALLSGAALSVCGLVMQTLFANPLADPSLLGVNSGASLGAAVVMLALGGTVRVADGMLGGTMLTIAGAFVGAAMVILLLVVASSMLRGTLALLVAGVMFSFAISAVISLLSFYATADGVRSFVVWGMGDFSGVTLTQMPLYALLVLLSGVAVGAMARPLNALLLGPDYATNLGVRVKRVRTLLLLLTGLLTATVTALCGPVSFIGLAVPHLARLFLRTADHRLLLPFSALLGANVAMLALLLSHLPGERGTIPLAAITPLIGVPVVLYILLKNRH